MKGLLFALTGLAGAVLRHSDDADDRGLGNLLLAGSLVAAATQLEGSTNG